MTEKQFTLDRDTVALNLKMPIVFNGERMNIGEVLDTLNELNDENKELKYKNEILSDELEQAKAVINKKWSEYLKKKNGMIE